MVFWVLYLTILTVSLTVKTIGDCDEDYYGEDCSVYCTSQDNDTNGHYDCDCDGQPVCHNDPLALIELPTVVGCANDTYERQSVLDLLGAIVNDCPDTTLLPGPILALEQGDQTDYYNYLIEGYKSGQGEEVVEEVTVVEDVIVDEAVDVTVVDEGLVDEAVENVTVVDEGPLVEVVENVTVVEGLVDEVVEDVTVVDEAPEDGIVEVIEETNVGEETSSKKNNHRNKGLHLGQYKRGEKKKDNNGGGGRLSMDKNKKKNEKKD